MAVFNWSTQSLEQNEAIFCRSKEFYIFRFVFFFFSRFHFYKFEIVVVLSVYLFTLSVYYFKSISIILSTKIHHVEMKHDSFRTMFFNIICPMFFIVIGLIDAKCCSSKIDISFFLVVLGFLILLNFFMCSLSEKDFVVRLLFRMKRNNTSIIICSFFHFSFNTDLLHICDLEKSFSIDEFECNAFFCHSFVYWTAFVANLSTLIGFLILIQGNINETNSTSK